jgi:hypothetical protein
LTEKISVSPKKSLNFSLFKFFTWHAPLSRFLLKSSRRE